MKKIFYVIIAIVLFSCNSNNKKTPETKDSLKTVDSIVSGYKNEEDNSLSNDYFYKHLKGTIDGNNVNMEFFKRKNDIVGSFFDETTQTEITFFGKMKNKTDFSVKEIEKQGVKQKQFTGKFTNSYTIEGNSNSGSFKLTEDYSNSIGGNIYSKNDSLKFNDEISCSESEIFFYPQKSPFPESLQKIQNEISKLFFSKILTKFPEEMQNNESLFLKDFKEASKSGDMYMSWDREMTSDIVYNSNGYVSFAIHSNEFAGGAHGNYSSVYFVFDIKTGNQLKYADIFKPEAKSKLEKIIYEKIKKLRGYDNNSMTSEYDANPIPANENFYLKQNGIGFFYNTYEITNYANGTDEVFIPFTEIKDLLIKTF